MLPRSRSEKLRKTWSRREGGDFVLHTWQAHLVENETSNLVCLDIPPTIEIRDSRGHNHMGSMTRRTTSSHSIATWTTTTASPRCAKHTLPARHRPTRFPADAAISSSRNSGSKYVGRLIGRRTLRRRRMQLSSRTSTHSRKTRQACRTSSSNPCTIVRATPPFDFHTTEMRTRVICLRHPARHRRRPCTVMWWTWKL